MTDDNGRNWMSCLGWGCLGVVVLSILGVGSCVAWVAKGGADARAVAAAYLQAVDTGRYEEAFAMLGPDLTGQRDLGGFVAFEQASRAELGACGGWQATGTSFNRDDGRTVARLTYAGSCDGGPLIVTFGLEKIDGSWRIQDVRYGDTEIPRVGTCTECGGVVPPGARFCPHCGAATDGGAESDGDGPAGETVG